VVESLAAGTPVLCSHNGGTSELVKDDGVTIQIEDDYVFGRRVPLYNPPKVDTNIIVEGILKVLEMEKIETREDLKISNVAQKYADLFV
jgi:glycosyltransferase involved in cell wall biosynthesis